MKRNNDALVNFIRTALENIVAQKTSAMVNFNSRHSQISGKVEELRGIVETRKRADIQSCTDFQPDYTRWRNSIVKITVFLKIRTGEYHEP